MRERSLRCLMACASSMGFGGAGHPTAPDRMPRQFSSRAPIPPERSSRHGRAHGPPIRWAQLERDFVQFVADALRDRLPRLRRKLGAAGGVAVLLPAAQAQTKRGNVLTNGVVERTPSHVPCMAGRAPSPTRFPANLRDENIRLYRRTHRSLGLPPPPCHNREAAMCPRKSRYAATHPRETASCLHRHTASLPHPRSCGHRGPHLRL